MSVCNHVGTRAEPCTICAMYAELSSLRGSCKALGEENKQLKRSLKKAANDFDAMRERVEEAERLLGEVLEVLRECQEVNKQFGSDLCDCVDNDGDPYQSAALDAFLTGKQAQP